MLVYLVVFQQDIPGQCGEQVSAWGGCEGSGPLSNTQGMVLLCPGKLGFTNKEMRDQGVNTHEKSSRLGYRGEKKPWEESVVLSAVLVNPLLYLGRFLISFGPWRP